MNEDAGMVEEDPIVVVDYDPDWPVRFAAERERLRAALGDVAERIDHVGSTSVPGLAAKPVVDVQVSVASFDPATRYDEPLRRLGYEPGDEHEPDHRFYIGREDGGRAFHVHVCETGRDWESDHLLFREFLKAHPVIAEEYGEIKRQAAAHHPRDREGYMEKKTPHLEAVMRHARRWFASSTIHGP